MIITQFNIDRKKERLMKFTKFVVFWHAALTHIFVNERIFSQLWTRSNLQAFCLQLNIFYLWSAPQSLGWGKSQLCFSVFSIQTSRGCLKGFNLTEFFDVLYCTCFELRFWVSSTSLVAFWACFKQSDM